MKSSTTNTETSNVEIPLLGEEVFHEVSESFHGESYSSSLNDDVQQSPEEVILPSLNTQSIPINMVPNGDEASTSHNVFNEQLEDAYFDASTSFHDPSNVHTYYQPYPHGKKWTKDHPLYKIIVHTPMVEQAKLKLDLVGKPVDHTDYRSMIGSLMYVTSSRPDIMFATYLWYPKDSGFDLTAYSDADHAGCHLDRKTEFEYVAVSGCCAQVLWMRTQLTDYGFFYDKVPIYCDSKSAIAISCNLVQHTRTKQIDVRVRLRYSVVDSCISLRVSGDIYRTPSGRSRVSKRSLGKAFVNMFPS
nr:hypothetical protein [Tanacetum cinerariifolium]